MRSEPISLTKGTGGDARVLRFPGGRGTGDSGAAMLVLLDECGHRIIDLPAEGEIRVEPTDRLGLSFSEHRAGRAARYLEPARWGTYERVFIESGDVGAEDLAAIGNHGVTHLHLGWSGHDRHGRRHEKPIDLPDDREAWSPLQLLRLLVVHAGGFGDEQLRGLGSRSWLKVLVLAGTHVTAGALVKAGLGGLEVLWLSDDESISDDLSFVATLPGLQTLGLRAVRLRDRHLRKLAANAQIRGLDLGHNRVGLEPLDALAALPELWDLDLTGTAVSDDTIASLATIPNLTRLKLGGTHVGDAAVPHLGRMGRVARLWLTRTGLTDDGLAELVRVMPQLRALDISMTSVTVDGTRHLRSLSNLFRLEIAPSQLTEEAVEMLADTTTIREVGLRGGTAGFDLIDVIVENIGALQRLPDA